MISKITKSVTNTNRVLDTTGDVLDADLKRCTGLWLKYKQNTKDVVKDALDFYKLYLDAAEYKRKRTPRPQWLLECRRCVGGSMHPYTEEHDRWDLFTLGHILCGHLPSDRPKTPFKDYAQGGELAILLTRVLHTIELRNVRAHSDKYDPPSTRESIRCLQDIKQVLKRFKCDVQAREVSKLLTRSQTLKMENNIGTIFAERVSRKHCLELGFYRMLTDFENALTLFKLKHEFKGGNLNWPEAADLPVSEQGLNTTIRDLRGARKNAYLARCWLYHDVDSKPPDFVLVAKDMLDILDKLGLLQELESCGKPWKPWAEAFCVLNDAKFESGVTMRLEYKADAMRIPRPRERPFVGRKKLLDEIEKMIDEATQEKKAVRLLLHGWPGVGKDSLCAELVHRDVIRKATGILQGWLIASDSDVFETMIVELFQAVEPGVLKPAGWDRQKKVDLLKKEECLELWRQMGVPDHIGKRELPKTGEAHDFFNKTLENAEVKKKDSQALGKQWPARADLLREAIALVKKAEDRLKKECPTSLDKSKIFQDAKTSSSAGGDAKDTREIVDCLDKEYRMMKGRIQTLRERFYGEIQLQNEDLGKYLHETLGGIAFEVATAGRFFKSGGDDLTMKKFLNDVKDDSALIQERHDGGYNFQHNKRSHGVIMSVKVMLDRLRYLIKRRVSSERAANSTDSESEDDRADAAVVGGRTGGLASKVDESNLDTEVERRFHRAVALLSAMSTLLPQHTPVRLFVSAGRRRDGTRSRVRTSGDVARETFEYEFEANLAEVRDDLIDAGLIRRSSEVPYVGLMHQRMQGYVREVLSLGRREESVDDGEEVEERHGRSRACVVDERAIAVARRTHVALVEKLKQRFVAPLVEREMGDVAQNEERRLLLPCVGHLFGGDKIARGLTRRRRRNSLVGSEDCSVLGGGCGGDGGGGGVKVRDSTRSSLVWSSSVATEFEEFETRVKALLAMGYFYSEVVCDFSARTKMLERARDLCERLHTSTETDDTFRVIRRDWKKGVLVVKSSIAGKSSNIDVTSLWTKNVASLTGDTSPKGVVASSKVADTQSSTPSVLSAQVMAHHSNRLLSSKLALRRLNVLHARCAIMCALCISDDKKKIQGYKHILAHLLEWKKKSFQREKIAEAEFWKDPPSSSSFSSKKANGFHKTFKEEEEEKGGVVSTTAAENGNEEEEEETDLVSIDRIGRRVERERLMVVSSLLNYIGQALRRLGSASQLSSAKSYYEESLKIRKALHGEETAHPKIAGLLINIGSVLYSQDNLDEALKMYNTCLRMQWTLFGKNRVHAEIAMSLWNISTVYVKKFQPTSTSLLTIQKNPKNLEWATIDMKKALDMADQLYKNEVCHHDRLEYAEGYLEALAYAVDGDPTESETRFNDFYQKRLKMLQEDDKTIRDRKKHIADWEEHYKYCVQWRRNYQKFKPRALLEALSGA
eukprot:g2794.t1